MLSRHANHSDPSFSRDLSLVGGLVRRPPFGGPNTLDWEETESPLAILSEGSTANFYRIETIELAQGHFHHEAVQAIQKLRIKAITEQTAWRVFTALLKVNGGYLESLQKQAEAECSAMVTSDFGDHAATELEFRFKEIAGGGLTVPRGYHYLESPQQVAYYFARALTMNAKDRLVFLNVTDPDVGKEGERTGELTRLRYAIHVAYTDEHGRPKDAIAVAPDCGQVALIEQFTKEVYPDAQIDLFEVDRTEFERFLENTGARPQQEAVNYEGLTFGRLAGMLAVVPEALYRFPQIFKPRTFEQTRLVEELGHRVEDKFGNWHVTKLLRNKEGKPVYEGRFQVKIENAQGKVLYDKELEVTRGFPEGKELIYITGGGFPALAVGKARFSTGKEDLINENGPFFVHFELITPR